MADFQAIADALIKGQAPVVKEKSFRGHKRRSKSSGDFGKGTYCRNVCCGRTF